MFPNNILTEYYLAYAASAAVTQTAINKGFYAPVEQVHNEVVRRIRLEFELSSPDKPGRTVQADALLVKKVILPLIGKMGYSGGWPST